MDEDDIGAVTPDEATEAIQEAKALADGYGKGPALALFERMYDEATAAFRHSPNVSNWNALTRCMYQLQHLKLNYGVK